MRRAIDRALVPRHPRCTTTARKEIPMRIPLVIPFALLGAAAGCGPHPTPRGDQLPAYLLGGSCSSHADTASCSADSSCHWVALGLACPTGTTCPSGACVANDACT